MDSFDKGWFVLQTYSGYENKVKENLLQRAQTYNMLENILRVEIPTQTVQVEKNGKTERYRFRRITREPFKTNSIVGRRNPQHLALYGSNRSRV